MRRELVNKAKDASISAGACTHIIQCDTQTQPDFHWLAQTDCPTFSSVEEFYTPKAVSRIKKKIQLISYWIPIQ